MAKLSPFPLGIRCETRWSGPRRRVCTLTLCAALCAPGQARAQSIDTVIRASDTAGPPGAIGVQVDVTTSAALEIGSTDLRLTFDPSILEAVDVASELEGVGDVVFDYSIDNESGIVSTASATGTGQSVPAGGAVITVTFNVLPTATGCSSLDVEDADGEPPDDLTAPAPPMPPPPIFYETAPSRFCVSVCGNDVVEGFERCDDGNVLDGDCCSSACEEPAPNGTSCDDGQFCTVNDSCQNGTCEPGSNRDCSAIGDQCNEGVCNEAANQCTPQPRTNGIACNDGNACTSSDVCQDGRCSGRLPSCSDLGDVDCDGRPSIAIDAQVILCLDADRCGDADMPPPCNDPRVRAARSDWNLDGLLSADDASTTLRIFVGSVDPAATSLGSCCSAAP